MPHAHAPCPCPHAHAHMPMPAQHAHAHARAHARTHMRMRTPGRSHAHTPTLGLVQLHGWLQPGRVQQRWERRPLWLLLWGLASWYGRRQSPHSVGSQAWPLCGGLANGLRGDGPNLAELVRSRARPLLFTPMLRPFQRPSPPVPHRPACLPVGGWHHARPRCYRTCLQPPPVKPLWTCGRPSIARTQRGRRHRC